MSIFTIAAAQSGSVRGDIQRNIEEHVYYAQIASSNGVNAIVFPELSITGYEPDLAEEEALDKDHDLLNDLINASNELDITIITGSPIRSGLSKPYIGAFIIQPNKPVQTYRKRFLHTGEEPYFIPSNDNVVFSLKKESIGIAICADIVHPTHPDDAKNKGATIYAAGVFMTPSGIDEAFQKMSSYAIKHNMVTVMSNYSSNSSKYTTGGKSAIWNNSGEIIGLTEQTERALVIASKNETNWTGKTIRI